MAYYNRVSFGYSRCLLLNNPLGMISYIPTLPGGMPLWGVSIPSCRWIPYSNAIPIELSTCNTLGRCFPFLANSPYYFMYG